MYISELSSKYIFNKTYLVRIMIRISLAETLKALNISRYELSKKTGIQYQIIDNYYKNKVIRYDSYVLERICDALNCNISDIIEYSKENQ